MMQILLILFWLLLPSRVFATVSIPWTTTFDCDDWQQDGNPIPCPSDMDLGNQIYYCTGSGDIYSRLNTTGNNPLGSGKGFAISWGDAENESGNNAATPMVTFSPRPSELYFRFYIKYPATWVWGTSPDDMMKKILYLGTAAHSSKAYVLYYGPNKFGLFIQEGDGIMWHQPDHTTCAMPGSYPDWGWNQLMSAEADNPYGAKYGDGEWHFMEFHLKSNTSSSPANGIYEMWVDGVLRDQHTDVEWDQSTFDHIDTMANGIQTHNGGCTYFYMDDISIQASGPIGPLEAGGSDYTTAIGTTATGATIQ